METREKQFTGLDHSDEEAYLADTLSLVRRNVENYSRESARMQEDIDVMMEHYHSDDPEVWTQLNNTITLQEHMKRALERNLRALAKPYFGRIIYRDKERGITESLYIGRGGIARDTTHQAVIDWRAPVANAYYENGLGECSYPAPDGTLIPIDLKLKRTYEIAEGRLIDYFDSEVIANDELLTKYLAKNKQAVLGEIIATIQKEQNDIIRRSPFHNLIVQGVAGSGKTTVAMHRISYILYNYAERFRPEDFYVVGSNRILLEYITGVLPDLDVVGIRQMTMEQLFVRLLYETWDSTKYRISENAQDPSSGCIRGTREWFLDLKRYCDKLEWDSILRADITLNPRQFKEGVRGGKTGVFDLTAEKPGTPSPVKIDPGQFSDDPGEDRLITLLSRESIENYIKENPSVSVQSKINMLNDRLAVKVADEFLGKGVKYTEAERKAITRAYRGLFGKKIWKTSIFDLYLSFLRMQQRSGKPIYLAEDQNTFDVYDLAALAYLYKRVQETQVISEAHHIVIDEAQDFGMMVYSVLDFCIKDCTYTVMGDVSQNIHFGYGLNDWEELRSLLLSGERSHFGILKKSYRNTVEISNFATDILHHGQFAEYPAEPIIRHGDAPIVRDLSMEAKAESGVESPSPGELHRILIREAAACCLSWQKEGLDTIAVVCRNDRQAQSVAGELGALLPVTGADLEHAVFSTGVMVLPVDYTKGLEFDAVLILDPDREDYPVDDGHAKLLYVAATRALHKLCILHTGNVTGLIADPVPERKRSPHADAPAPAPQPITGSAKAAGNTAKSLSNPIHPAGKSARSMDDPAKTTQSRAASAATPRNTAGNSTASGTRKRVTATLRPKTSLYTDSALIRRYSDKPGTESAGTAEQANAPAREAAPTRPRATARTVAAGTASGDYTYGIGHRSAPGQPPQPPAIPRQKTPNPPSDVPVFGDMPTNERLRLPGHARIELSARWILRNPDGLYINSRYGTLRICPIAPDVIRISFARERDPESKACPAIAMRDTDCRWLYREKGGTLELSTDELLLSLDKSTGAIQFRDAKSKLLFAERNRECRQIDTGVTSRSILFVDWPKNEILYGTDGGDHKALALRKSAYYLTASGNNLPLIFSDRGYGIVPAGAQPVIFCEIPSYGSYISQEKTDQLDYYFLFGKTQNGITALYQRLLGRES